MTLILIRLLLECAFEALSHQKALAKLLEAMDYPRLRKEQAVLRKQGVYLGIGLSVFFEITNPSPMFYGVGGARIGAQEGCTMRLEPSGAVMVSTGITEQGQGAETVVAQIAASAIGVSMRAVKVINGDTDTCPPGSGAWASRQTGIVGEAVLQAGIALKKNILEVGAILLQRPADQLDIVDGKVVASTGQASITLTELARIVYYRGNELPKIFSQISWRRGNFGSKSTHSYLQMACRVACWRSIRRPVLSSF